MNRNQIDGVIQKRGDRVHQSFLLEFNREFGVILSHRGIAIVTLELRSGHGPNKPPPRCLLLRETLDQLSSAVGPRILHTAKYRIRA